MANILRNLVLDQTATFGDMHFLGFEEKYEYKDGKYTDKIASLDVRVMSMANAGEITISLDLTEVPNGIALMDKVEFGEVEVEAKPRKIDNQNPQYIKALQDWIITAKSIKKVESTNKAGSQNVNVTSDKNNK